MLVNSVKFTSMLANSVSGRDKWQFHKAGHFFCTSLDRTCIFLNKMSQRKVVIWRLIALKVKFERTGKFAKGRFLSLQVWWLDFVILSSPVLWGEVMYSVQGIQMRCWPYPLYLSLLLPLFLCTLVLLSHFVDHFSTFDSFRIFRYDFSEFK